MGSAIIPEVQRASRTYRWARSGWLWTLGALIPIGMAVFGIVGSWTSLSATWDEPLHIAGGMEWLDKGRYTYTLEQPPLARIATALGPYLKGLRSSSLPDAIDEGNAILYSTGNYRSNLAAARSGNLLFLALAGFSVFLWAHRWFGRAAAGWAVLLFVSLPHSWTCGTGYARYGVRRNRSASPVRVSTLPGGSGMAAAPSPGRVAGGRFPLQVLEFRVPRVVLSLLLRLRRRAKKKGGSPRAGHRRRLFVRLLIVSGVTFALLWAGYRFSWQPMASHSGACPRIDRVFAKQPLLRSLAYKAIDAPIPLAQIVSGIHQLEVHNAYGESSYLFGEYRDAGWWYFFPVVVGVKTPIGFLILAGCGIFAILRGFRSSPWQRNLTVIFPVAIMLVCMISKIDLGVRHILPIYPPLAVIGGYAMSEFFVLAKRTSRTVSVLAIMLAAWVVIDSWMVRPDYLAYFNQFAGAHPERILAESDLDWGQDLYRLSQRLKELHVSHVAIGYFGTAPLEKAGLPQYSVLSADVPTTGYVAVSVRYLTLEYAKDGSFGWLRGRTPLQMIGKSIYLYNL